MMNTAALPLLGRVALVIGASRRTAIGAAIVRRLINDGAAVFMHSWSPADAEKSYGEDIGGVERLMGEIRAMGGEVAHLSADLADPEAPAQVVSKVLEAFGRLDIVVANHARSTPSTLEELTAAEIDLTYAINARATLLIIKEFAAHHHDSRGGRVVLFTSGQYHGAMPEELPYIASKAALHELTPSLAAHLIPRGITVNCVNPGPNNTGYGDATG